MKKIISVCTILAMMLSLFTMLSMTASAVNPQEIGMIGSVLEFPSDNSIPMSVESGIKISNLIREEYKRGRETHETFYGEERFDLGDSSDELVHLWWGNAQRELPEGGFLPPNGCFAQDFQGGNSYSNGFGGTRPAWCVIVVTPKSFAKNEAYTVRDAIATQWSDLGGTNSYWVLPDSNQYWVGDMCYQEFTRGIAAADMGVTFVDFYPYPEYDNGSGNSTADKGIPRASDSRATQDYEGYIDIPFPGGEEPTVVFPPLPPFDVIRHVLKAETSEESKPDVTSNINPDPTPPGPNDPTPPGPNDPTNTSSGTNTTSGANTSTASVAGPIGTTSTITLEDGTTAIVDAEGNIFNEEGDLIDETGTIIQAGTAGYTTFLGMRVGSPQFWGVIGGGSAVVLGGIVTAIILIIKKKKKNDFGDDATAEATESDDNNEQ